MQLTTGCPVNPARVLACHDRAVQLGPLHVGSRVYPFDAKVGDLVLDAVVVFLFHEQRLLGCTGLTYRFKPLALQGRATAKRLNKQVTTFNQLFAMMEADIRECVAAIEGHRSGARKLALSAYRSTAQGRHAEAENRWPWTIIHPPPPTPVLLVPHLPAPLPVEPVPENTPADSRDSASGVSGVSMPQLVDLLACSSGANRPASQTPVASPLSSPVSSLPLTPTWNQESSLPPSPVSSPPLSPVPSQPSGLPPAQREAALCHPPTPGRPYFPETPKHRGRLQLKRKHSPPQTPRLSRRPEPPSLALCRTPRINVATPQHADFALSQDSSDIAEWLDASNRVRAHDEEEESDEDIFPDNVFTPSGVLPI